MKVVEKICNKVAVLDHGELVETGYVRDVFMAPKSRMAKKLILPSSEAVDEVTGSDTIRIVFDGRSAFEPVISNMSLECHTAVNILAADTKVIDDKSYGQMVLQLPDDPEAVERIKTYLRTKEIRFEEEKIDDIRAAL